MNRKRIAYMFMACILLGSTTVYGERLTVKYSGTANAGDLVGLMVVDADADSKNLQKEDVYVTDIMKADTNGKVSKTVVLEDAVVDSTSGKISNYKALSNIALTEEILKTEQPSQRYAFESFTTRPVFINGVLYVPIEETLDRIGGDTVSYAYDAETKTYTGEANNGEFTIVMEKNTIEVDWVDVELPGKSTAYNGVNMMPAYAIEYLLKTGALSYDAESFTLAEGVKEKFPEREIDMAAIVKKLPQPQRTVVSNSQFLTTCSTYGGDDLISVHQENVEIDGEQYTAQQIETTHDKFGTIPSVDSLQVLAWLTNGEFKKQEIGLLSFKARATKITDESGSARVGVRMQAPNYALAIEEYIAVTDQWQQFYLPAYNAFNDYPGSYQSRLCFTVGGKPMTLQIADFSLVSYGIDDEIKTALTQTPDAEGYKGIEDDHIWRKEAWNRVEKYRKEDILTAVTDTNGNPVAGAEIAVKMTENEFMFGAAMCENEVLNLDMGTKKGVTLDKFMTDDINTGVCADMMKSTEVIHSDGAYGIEMVNEYLRRGMRVRGHCMYWDGVDAAYLDTAGKNSYNKMYMQTMDYVRSMAYNYKGRLVQWDVLNEPVSNNHIRLDYNTTRLYSDIFKEINRIDPEVKLYINETGIEGRKNKFMADRIPGLITNIIEPLKKEGAPVHGVGVQAHCSNYYYPQGFYHQLDDLAQAVDEVAVTEYDFYNENTTYAPNHLEDLLLATVSHPKATAFVIWNPEDSMHWRWDDAAPFFKRDWSSKPAHLKWQELIKNVYTTDETRLTDEFGKVSVRAFRGDYEITCTYNGISKKVVLGNTADGGSTVRFLLDGDTISALVSSNPRTMPNAIAYDTRTEAKRAYDANNEPYYINMMLDTNFKGSEKEALVVNGGDLSQNEAYQNGEIWGSANGMAELLAGTDAVDTIITTKEPHQSGCLYRKARTTVSYEDSTLYQETMFSTLSPKADHSVNIICGISQNEKLQDIARIVYNNGAYAVEMVDGRSIRLEQNSNYTLKTGIIPTGGTYDITYEIIKDGIETVETDICKNNLIENLMQVTEAVYAIDALSSFNEDVLKLHNARLYEYREGKIIELDKADLDTYFVNEDMKISPPELPYIGTSLLTPPSEWGIIGANNIVPAFAYQKNGMCIAAIQKNQAIGAHSLVKGFRNINAGESMEIGFDLWLNVTTPGMDSVGTGVISVGNADKSSLLRLAQYRFTPWNDDNTQNYPFEIKFLDAGGGYQYARKISDGNHDAAWKRNFIHVTLSLTPDLSGRYNAELTAVAADGETVTVKIEEALTEEQVLHLNTIFIEYQQDTAGTNHNGSVIFGVRNVKIRKYGKTMYTNDIASLPSGRTTAIGIKYNNITGAETKATVITAAYLKGELLSCRSMPVYFEKGKGCINIDIPAETGIDSYKIFLWEEEKALKPYKEADTILIQ